MLVLARKSGESILIGDDIRVRVLKASGSRVKLGVEAPEGVRILRQQADPDDAVQLEPEGVIEVLVAAE